MGQLDIKVCVNRFLIYVRAQISLYVANIGIDFNM